MREEHAIATLAITVVFAAHSMVADEGEVAGQVKIQALQTRLVGEPVRMRLMHTGKIRDHVISIIYIPNHPRRPNFRVLLIEIVNHGVVHERHTLS